MNYRRYFLRSLPVLALSLPLACAKQAVTEDNSSGAGGIANVFAGGAGSGSGTSTSDIKGSAATGNVNGTLPPASQTEDGTVAVDASAVTEALADPVTACQGAAVEAEAEPAVLLFLVDASGSMRFTAPSTGNESKWAITRSALKTAIQGLPSSYGVGLSFYPNMAILADTINIREASFCVNRANDVPLDLASAEQQSRLVAALDGTEPVATGATPTHDAFNFAVEQLANTTLTGRRYIVLITDGQPTQAQGCIGTGIMCDPTPTDPIIASIRQAWVSSEIKTFVVGSPGSEKNECTKADVRDWLSRAASAGQTAADNCSDAAKPYCHFDLSEAADFGVALTDALTAITRSLLACDYGVPQVSDGKVLDPNAVNMFFSDGTGSYWLLLPDDLGTCDKGWRYTDTNKDSVQICGDTCKLLQDSAHARLSILFGCTPGSLPIF